MDQLTEHLRALIEERGAKRNSLTELVTRNTDGMTSEDAAAFDAASNEVRALDAKIASLTETIKHDERTTEARALTGVPASTATASTATAGEELRSTFKTALERGSASVELRTQLVSESAKGGATVPTTFSDTIIERMGEVSQILSLVDIINTTTAEPISEIIETNTLEANWVGEAAQIPASDLTYENAILNAYKLTALTNYSVEIVAQSALNIEARVRDAQGRKLGAKLAKSVLVGTGVNQPKGLYVDAVSGVTVADEDALTLDELVALKHSVPARFRKSATWVLTPSAALSIELLKDLNGRPLFREAVSADVPATLLGHPYIIEEDAPRVGFGDLKAAYKLRQVQAVNTEVSKEFKFDTAQLVCRSIVFADGRPADGAAFRVAASV